MAKYIQLYLDTDFILPIGVGESGEFQKYFDQQASRRFWLYFNKTSNNMYESSEVSKANFEAGREGFYGDFWKHIEDGDTVSGTSFSYLDLLEISRIIAKIREWSKLTLLTESPEVVLNFSTVIPLKARRAFADYIQEKIGKVRSYSIELNDLLSSKVIYDNRGSLNPVFGDQLMIIQSAGRDILLSVLTWCGDMFMQGDDCVRLEKRGNEYLKYALAKIVVDHYEQAYRRLTPERKEQEYLYQMQFTEGWLSKRKDEDSFWVDNFHYSNNPERVYTSFEVDGKQLDLIEEEAIRSTICQIGNYYRENIKNRHLHTILLGDVFKEEVFLKNCISVTSSEKKNTPFDDNKTQEALGRYFVKHSTFTENLAELESKYWEKSKQREKIRKYVKSAEILGSLRTKLDESIKSLSQAVTNAENRNADLKASWNAYMKRSKFTEASETIENMSVSDSLLVAKNQSELVILEVNQQNPLLDDLKELVDVADIINNIKAKKEELGKLIENAEQLNNLPKSLAEKTQNYKNLYGQYQEIKRLFNSEPTLSARRALVERMKTLTMEDTPVLDVEPIRGSIAVKAGKTGGFLGFGAKKMITISLNIEEPLPCRGVLVVSAKAISSMPQDRYGVYCLDVEKGRKGEVTLTEETKTLNLGDSPKSLFVKFWPHEEEKVPINRFEVTGGGTITI